MRAVVQRVIKSTVRVDSKIVGEISKGLTVFVGAEKGDGLEDVNYIVKKIAGLRIFCDEDGKMNLSLEDIRGEALIVSQFTLSGDARKGRRPSFQDAEEPLKAKALVEKVSMGLKSLGLKVAEGEFGAHMGVEILNDGPVTILLDSRKQF